MNAKKWCSLLLSMMFILASMPMAQANVSNVVAIPSPNTVGSNASYRIRFTTTEQIPANGWVEVTFPSQFQLGDNWQPHNVQLKDFGLSDNTAENVVRIGQKVAFQISEPSGTGFKEFILNVKTLPGIVTLGSPENNEKIEDDIDFTWQSVASATRYHLVVRESWNDKIVHEKQNITDTQYTLDNLGTGRYRWNVRAGNDQGWGEWNENYEYFYHPCPPPQDNHAVGKRVKVFDNPTLTIRAEPNKPIDDSTPQALEGDEGKIIDGPVEAGDKYWWKVDWDAEEHPSGWSDGRHLELINVSSDSIHEMGVAEEIENNTILPLQNVPGNLITNPINPGNYRITLQTFNQNNDNLGTAQNSSNFDIVAHGQTATRASVLVEPNIAGANAKMTMEFRLASGTQNSLSAGDIIRIRFDRRLVGENIVNIDSNNFTTVPGNIARSCIRINNRTLTVNPQIIAGFPGDENNNGQAGWIDIIIPQNINSTATQGAMVTIELETCANIFNPVGNPWDRQISIQTLRSDGTTVVQDEMLSSAYRIERRITTPQVTVVPAIRGMNAQYTLTMTIGEGSILRENSGRIDVFFPEGTHVPSSISASSIQITVGQDTSSPPFEPLVSGQKVSFVMPTTVREGDEISILFRVSAGIRNPSTPGIYHLRISTSADPSIISSDEYHIRPYGTAQVTPVPNTTIRENENTFTKFTITFQTGYYLDASMNDRVRITFPGDFDLDDFDNNRHYFKINGYTPEVVNRDNNTIKISLPEGLVIANNSLVEVVIDKAAQIRNPSFDENNGVSPTYYRLTVETQRESMTSDEFMIYSPVRYVRVIPENSAAGRVSAYDVHFEYGNIRFKNNDRIFIEFPSGTSVPSFISTRNVEINQGAIQSILVRGELLEIVVRDVPQNLEDPIHVRFRESCGIRNPGSPGFYRAHVSHSRESVPVASEPYNIGTVGGDVQVTVEPNIALYGRGVNYNLQFNTGSAGGLSTGQIIEVAFPPEYWSIFNNLGNIIPSGRILVNGFPTTNASQFVRVVDQNPIDGQRVDSRYPLNSRVVLIETPIDIQPQSQVRIEFLPTADIDTPPVDVTPQPFYLRVATASEPSVISGIFKIVSTLRGQDDDDHYRPIAVELDNFDINRGTGITLTLQTGPAGRLTSGSDRIRIKFPPETYIPGFIPRDHIRINDERVLTPTIQDHTISFQIPHEVAIENNQNIEIQILSQAGIINPKIPGNYQLYVSSTREPTEVPTDSYAITGVSIARPTVSPVPSLANAEDVQYTIRFMTGTYGRLNVGDTITFSFDESYIDNDRIPRGVDIPPQYILVNDVPCIIPPTRRTNQGQNVQLTIYTPVDIDSNSSVTVIFTQDAGIQNPEAARMDYTIGIWTLRDNSETNPLRSNNYAINESHTITRPVVTVTPCTPFSPSRYTLEFFVPVDTLDTSNNPPTSNDYNLPAGSQLTITFPNTTFIPSIMDGSKILFSTESNHNIPCQVNPIINGYRVTLTTPLDIDSADYVKIDFLRDAGLQNPDAGNYELTIHTVHNDVNRSSDQNNSYAYHICPDLSFGRLEITPSPMRVPQGRAQIFVARAYDADGRLMDYGVTYRWNLSSNIGILENSSMQTVEFYARHMGKANLSVVAQYGNRTISTSTEVVVTGALSRLELTPGAISTSRGETTRFSVQAFDSNNEELDDVSFEWSMHPDLGRFSFIPLSNDVDFVAEKEGQCIIRVRANYRGIVKEVEAQVTIKVGVNSLAMMPSQITSNPQPGEILGPFKVELRDSEDRTMNAFSDVSIRLSSSSAHARFSLDGIEWTSSNSLFMTIVANFNETPPFYVSILEPGDCTIVASSSEFNSFVMPLSVRGSRKRIAFLTSSQDLRRNVPSEIISIQIQDTMRQPYAVNEDVLIELKTSSPHGQFSSLTEPWVTVDQIILSQNQHTIDFYYRDTREGAIAITVSHALFGSATQTMSVASPGSVSMPEVTVDPAIAGVRASYEISFNVGFDGALEAMRDEINVVFPEGTRLPPSIPSSMITINDRSLQFTPTIEVHQRLIRMVVPSSIASTERVVVRIPNITNPEGTGEHVLNVFTSAQTAKADSLPYKIELSTIADFQVEIKPIIAGAEAEYHISFSTGLRGSIDRGQTITLLFDYAIHVPSTMQGSHILFNGIPLTEEPHVEGKAVMVRTPRPIDANTKINIMFSADCGIRNPLYPGVYFMHAYTQAEQALVRSAPFEIVQQSLIRNLKLKATPAMISQSAEYTITFETGPYGALTSEDTITLVLPDLVMPMNLPSNALSVNNIRIQQALQVRDHTINIRVPSFIPANEQVTIVIYRQAGIANPPRPANDYRIMAHTSKEPHPVTSEPFAIESELIINYILNPTQPDGANQWYITEPLLIFTSNVPAKIYYRINHGPEREYTDPVRLAEHGQNTIYYRGVSILENPSEEKSFTYKYDGTPPIIETNIEEETMYTREKQIAFSILIKDIAPVTVTLNDRPINLINNSYSTILELNEGENRFAIRAMDEAGNVARVERLVIFKAKPPMLMITSPASFQVLRDVYFATTPSGSELFANVRVRGSTEIGIEEIEVISDTVDGFSTKISVDALGNFDRTIGIRSLAGSNVLLFKARDRVGNETQVIVAFMLQITLRLRIGVETGYVNGNPVQLGAEPYLKYGRHTMMPFRLIAESFGATVGWEQATRKVSYTFRGTHIALWIGRNTAEVTDASGRTRIVTLLAEPEIIASRTWVPLRFVSEALGAQVDWDPKLWEAIVHFPPLS